MLLSTNKMESVSETLCMQLTFPALLNSNHINEKIKIKIKKKSAMAFEKKSSSKIRFE